jgi:hypothetical protein
LPGAGGTFAALRRGLRRATGIVAGFNSGKGASADAGEFGELVDAELVLLAEVLEEGGKFGRVEHGEDS